MKKGNVFIEVDSQTGDITVDGEGENFYKVCDVIKAIGRGFSPEKALKLLENDYLLKIISIKDYVGKNSSAQQAKRGRVIGREGFARNEIERKTNSFVSVQGKTVAIISRVGDLEAAMKSVEMLLKGAKHETMQHYLETKDNSRFEL
jgi:ribosomal RNA assembly protein